MKILIIGIISVTLGGIVAGLVKSAKFKRRKVFEKFIPHIEIAGGDKVKIERFGNYVVEQLGLKGSDILAPHLVEVAEEYVRGDKSSADGSAERVRNVLRNCSMKEMDLESLSNDMIAEFDACIYSYFAFHWNHASLMMKQVFPQTEINKIRQAIFTHSRRRLSLKQTKQLSTKFTFTTLIERLKAVQRSNSIGTDDKTVLVAAGPETRCPVLLLMGGGMGAGKSTVVKEILRSPFWSAALEHAVKVEADAFKEADHPGGSDLFDEYHLPEKDQVIHKLSTDAASSLLVTALNEGHDVIFDGTMSWEPFVLQTIDMVRDIHKRQYRMGPGYKEIGNGKIEEKYWEPLDVDVSQDKRPYRIELVGVICDAHLAVVRGMRRAILTKRGVPIKAQLRSHKWFSGSLEKYCDLVDEARVYCTSKIGQPPELIAWKGGGSKLLKDCEAFQLIEQINSLNPCATSVVELYQGQKDGELLNRTFWEVVLDPCRESRQENLLAALKTIPSDSDVFARSSSLNGA